jgi:hypothetical protein
MILLLAKFGRAEIGAGLGSLSHQRMPHRRGCIAPVK